MGHADAELGHLLQDGGRWRGGRGHHVDGVIEIAALLGAGVDQQAHDHRRAAQMADPLLGDRPVDGARLDPAQAHLGPSLEGHRPGKAPAIAVEHRQGPEIGWVQTHVPDQNVTDRVQIGAPMVGDHTLGLAGRPRGVAERDRLPLFSRMQRLELGIPLGQQLVIGQLTQPLATNREHGIQDIHDQRLFRDLPERGFDCG